MGLLKCSAYVFVGEGAQNRAITLYVDLQGVNNGQDAGIIIAVFGRHY